MTDIILPRRQYVKIPIHVSLSRSISPALFASICVFVITLIALFVPPYIGMADNGDYFRIIYSNGLYFNVADYNSQYLGYFVKSYGILQYYNENGATLFSSQSMFIWLALHINEIFYSKFIFDIRFQAAIFTVLYALAVYLLVESITWKATVKQGYLIAVLAVFIFGDTAYTAYFNSFYSESIVYFMTLFVFASGLLLYRNRYNDYFLLILFGLSGLILTTSKQQNAPVGIIICCIGVFLIFIRKAKLFRIVAVIVLLSLLIAGICTYILIPKEFENINKYHAMTRGVLMNSSDPEAALKKFGIDKQYAILNGTIYYSPYTSLNVESDQMEQQFYNKFGFGSILAYYIGHPDQSSKMLNLAAKGAFTIRPAAMGNYEKSADREFGKQTKFFSVYSLLKNIIVPKTFGFIVIWITIIIGLYMPSFISAIKSRQMRQAMRMPLIVTMIAVGLSGIVVSIIGAGDADLAKHEFLFTIVFDLITFMTVTDLVCRRLWQNEQPESIAE